jgi:hypothetical protein
MFLSVGPSLHLPSNKYKYLTLSFKPSYKQSKNRLYHLIFLLVQLMEWAVWFSTSSPFISFCLYLTDMYNSSVCYCNSRTPLSLLYNWFRVYFPGVKQPERGVNHPLLATRLNKGRAITVTPLGACFAYHGIWFTFCIAHFVCIRSTTAGLHNLVSR